MERHSDSWVYCSTRYVRSLISSAKTQLPLSQPSSNMTLSSLNASLFRLSLSDTLSCSEVCCVSAGRVCHCWSKINWNKFTNVQFCKVSIIICSHFNVWLFQHLTWDLLSSQVFLSNDTVYTFQLHITSHCSEESLCRYFTVLIKQQCKLDLTHASEK